MHYVFTFTTSKFDVSQEDENDINPIYGQSLLLWLKEKTRDRVDISDPDCEDWGWYAYADWKGRRYLLGASTEESSREANGEYAWFFQLSGRRSFKEWLFGRGKGLDDECLCFFKSFLESEPDVHDLKVDL